MCKDQYTLTQTPFTYILLILPFIFPTGIFSNTAIQQHSVITLPIEADLIVLEKYLNDFLPQELSDINEPDKVCMEAQYLKTKGIPKCRLDGLKISCKSQSIKIKTIPEIKCDITGWVKRDGPISLSGDGQTLKFAFPIKAEVSADAGIRATADASAILYIEATPSINEDWSVSVDIKPHFVWSKQPTVILFETIKVNIKNKVEPKLHNKINDFIKKMPTLLAELNMKEKIDTVWNEIQEPMKIYNKTETYLLFKPESASYSGFNIVDNRLITSISAEGKTDILIGKPHPNYTTKTTLCDLGSIPCKEGEFNFHLPVSISYRELLDISEKKLLHDFSINVVHHSLPGAVKVSKPKIEKTLTGKIRISAHIIYDSRSKWLKMIDIFNWFDIDGEITFKGFPRINKEKRSIVFDNLSYDSTTNNDLFDLLVDTAQIQPIQSYFSHLIEYEFGQKIDDGIIKANQALTKLSKDALNLSASLQMASIDTITLNEEHIVIHTKLSGKVHAAIELNPLTNVSNRHKTKGHLK